MNEPERLDEYEGKLDDVDLKALLAQQNAYLYQIATILESTQSQQDAPEDIVTCSMCNESYPEDEVVEHAIEEHNAPPDIDPNDIGQTV